MKPEEVKDLREYYKNNFTGVDFSRQSLVFADLRGCFFNRANLSEIDLCCARLRSADFTDADLSDAYLCGADLTNAKLGGANLKGASFARVIGDGNRLVTLMLPYIVTIDTVEKIAAIHDLQQSIDWFLSQPDLGISGLANRNPERHQRFMEEWKSLVRFVLEKYQDVKAN